MTLSKTYSDDEYYTTEDAAKKFVDLVVVPSGILNHKIILMPFSNSECPLYKSVSLVHDNIICFEGDQTLWLKTSEFKDVAVIDNPPFSLSAKVEKEYFEKGVPFVLFRSSVSYPKFIFKQEYAGIIYENSRRGVRFSWGLGKHIQGDNYIKDHYPNLIDNMIANDMLYKHVPIGFSFFKTDYNQKVGTVTFDKLIYPKKKEQFVYVQRGVYDRNTKIYVDDEDGRVKIISI